MAYSWVQTIVQYDVVLAADTVELHTNINSERTARGLGGYSWSQTPSQYVAQIQYNDILEMRTALDQAHSQNYCVSAYSVCPDHCPSYLYYTNTCTANLYAYYYNGYYGTYELSCTAAYYATHYANYNSTY